MYLIDTNIFLEVFLNQNRADECESLILRLNNGAFTAYVSSFTIHSIEVILERNNKLIVLKNFLKDLSESKGLRRYDTTTIDEMRIVENSQKLKIDFDDAVNYYICKSLNLTIISFDRHFDMSKIYHQSMTDGRKSNVVAQDGIFSSMLKNYRLCTGWLARATPVHAIPSMTGGF